MGNLIGKWECATLDWTQVKPKRQIKKTQTYTTSVVIDLNIVKGVVTDLNKEVQMLY